MRFYVNQAWSQAVFNVYLSLWCQRLYFIWLLSPLLTLSLAMNSF